MVKRAQFASLSDKLAAAGFDQSPFWRSAAVRVDGGNLPALGRCELFTAGDRFRREADGSKLRRHVGTVYTDTALTRSGNWQRP